MRCFSRKGFEAASMQEIAHELGMAKGSLYFYFKSKDDLFLSVIGYFGERMLTELALLPEERRLPPRERLLLQLRRYYAFVAEHREFPIMLMREPMVAESRRTKMHGFMVGFRRRFQRWLRQHIEDIYGEAAGDYAEDGTVLFGGMMLEYMRLLLIGQPALDGNRLAQFQVERLDDLMQGMLRSQVGPMLPQGYVDRCDGAGEAKTDDEDGVRQAAQALRRKLESEAGADEAGESRDDLAAALSRFEEEFAKPIPDRIEWKGMLALLKAEAPARWQADVERLAEQANKRG